MNKLFCSKELSRFVLLVAIIFGSSILANSATFTVTKTDDTNDGICNTDCSLREAIEAANAAASDDVIEFEASVFDLPRVITLTISGLSIANNGSLVINGKDPNLLTVSGNNQRGVLYSGGKVTVNRITIADGAADEGGGIRNAGGVLNINNSIIRNNSATFQGGGIYNNGTLTVNDSTVCNNSSREGGIFQQVGVVTINNSTICENSGGGISTRSLVNINSSTINNNNSGGIYNFNGTVNLTNSTVSGNFNNSSSGGGITVEGGTLNLTNATIAFNSTSWINGGGGVYRSNTNTTVNVRNSIIARNMGGSVASDFTGTLNSQGYNLIGSTAFTTITGDTTGNLLNIDPLLLPLNDNGGSTQTHALRVNSPAIDAGEPTNVLAADQRGVSRPADGDGNGSARIDIGAVEAGILVTNTDDSGTGSLRQAVADANATTGNDEIRFSTIFDTPQIISLTSGELVLANSGNIIINGTGAENLTISGKNQNRLFSINAETNATISNITIADGKVDNGSGGGILNSGVLTLNNAVIKNNKANQSGNGGGIYNANGSTATLTNSIVRNNSAIDGGGIGSGYESNVTIRNSTINQNIATSNGGGISSFNSELTIINSTVSNNSGGDGGGIKHGYNSAAAALINSTVSGNQATGDGGGIYNDGVFSLTNSTISNNSAAFRGGGINNNLGNVSLTNSTVSGNSASYSGGILNAYDRLIARSSIVAGNTATNGSPDFSGTFTSQGYNLIGNTNGVIINGETTGNFLNVNPRLLPLADNGGATQTHALQADSPAVDAGAPANVLAADGRGFNRATDGNGDGAVRADIGAFELGTLVANTNDSGAGSFRQAVSDARVGAGDDEIRLSTLFNTPQTIVLTTGEVFIGGNGSLIIAGESANLLTISGNNQSRVLNVGLFADLTLNNVIITGGKVNWDGGGIINHGKLTINNSIVSGNTASGGGNNPAAGGGGIFNAGRLLLTNTSLSNNNTTSFNGGGILNSYGTITINNSIIRNNTASSEGGGLGNFYGTVTVTDSVISSNKSSRSGGILNAGTLTIKNSSVNDNTARQLYGGIYNGGILTVTNSTISNNSGTSSGGGIFNLGTAVLSGSTVSGNSSDRGAGINNNGGTNNDRGSLSIVNSTISGNIASISGGGISTAGGKLTLTNLTIAFNSANTAGGIMNSGTSIGIRNSIIARNKSTGAAPDFSGVFGSQGYNLIGNASGASIIGETTGNQINIDPLLDPVLRDNDYIVRTHALRLNSPAVDKGSMANEVNNDQRQLMRPFDFTEIPNAQDGNGSDIGAFERQVSDTISNTLLDFDGDGRSDISVFRPESGVWHLLQSQLAYAAPQFGVLTDKLVPADYDGDGKTDLAVFRENPNDPGKAKFFILNSSNNQLREEQLGSTGDIPVSGDWDGDGKIDVGVYRSGTEANQQGYFYYRPSSQSNIDFVPYPWGIAGDKPIVADYDGDGKADPAVFRPSNGGWYIQRSRDGFYAIQFGTAEDRPVVGDYDGDGKADQAVFRPSNGVWYIWNSTTGFSAAQFGISTDKPVPADYDGDGKTDIAIYRDGGWFILNSTNGFAALGFGTATDKPVANSFVPTSTEN